VHSLLHLPMFVRIHGPLDNFSCFKYENFLQYIKKSIKCAKYPLQEIYNRIIEKQKVFISNPLKECNYMILTEMENRIPSKHYNLTDTLIKKIILPNLKITIDVSKEKDQFIYLKNNSLVVIKYIVKSNDNEIKLIVNSFLSVSEIFSTPISSITIGSYLVDLYLVSESITISIADIKYKCLVVGIGLGKAIMTVLSHSLHETVNND